MKRSRFTETQIISILSEVFARNTIAILNKVEA